MTAIETARSLTIPIDPSQPVQLGRGYDSFAGVLRGDAVVSDGQTATDGAGGGQKTTYSMQTVTSVSDLKASLNIAAAGTFGGPLKPADARVEFVGSLNMHRYYTYLLVHCTVENATTYLKSYLLEDDAKAFVGTPNPNIQDFYDKWGDMFVASYVSGGEFIGVVEFQTETDQAQAALAAQINVAGGTWTAGADFKSQIETLSQTAQTSVMVYMNGSTQPVPSLEGLVSAAVAFPSAVDPSQGGKPVLYSIVVSDYDPALPAGVHGPSVDHAVDLLEQYGTLADRLTLAGNSLDFVAQYVERFPISMSEVQALQQQVVTLQGRIQAGVAQLEESPMDASTVIPPDLEPAIERIEAAIPAGRAPLYSGWPLALQADNGMFLCRWQAFGFEATKASPDESSWFAVGIRNDGAITLQADTARYLSLENTQDLLFDKDVGEVDQDCWFIPSFNGSGQVAFQAANGLYVSRNGPQDFQAYKSALDQYCWLTTRVNTTGTGATSG